MRRFVLLLLSSGCQAVYAPTVFEPMSQPLPTKFTVGDRYTVEACAPMERRTGQLLAHVYEQTGAHALVEVTVDRRTVYANWFFGVQVTDCVTLSAIPVRLE